MEIQLDSNQTIPVFQDIIDFIEDSKDGAPHEGKLYYLNLLKAMALRNENVEPRTSELLAMFYCYLKIQEIEKEEIGHEKVR